MTLILQTLKKNRGTILGYTIASVILIWMFVAIFPSFAGQAEEMTKAFENYPEAMLKALNIEMQSFLTSLDGFLAGENYSIMWPIILIILVIAFASSAIAGEVERGTIEILLAQPISRIKLFLGKYLAGAAIIFIFVFASIFSVVPFAALYDVDIVLENHIVFSMLGACFALALYSVAMMLSSIFSERGKVASLSGGLLMSMYFLNIFAAFKESLDSLKYLSLFHYFDFNTALLKGELDPQSIAVFLGVSLVCTLIGLFWFNRRDITTA